MHVKYVINYTCEVLYNTCIYSSHEYMYLHHVCKFKDVNLQKCPLLFYFVVGYFSMALFASKQKLM